MLLRRNERLTLTGRGTKESLQSIGSRNPGILLQDSGVRKSLGILPVNEASRRRPASYLQVPTYIPYIQYFFCQHVILPSKSEKS